ncbi:MAG: hypothetical protein CBB71_23310 [Rhodopirellula sp. TMED11]|nr:MAG: hypothetical protein CBB71_23310 [Rhodopirellula sp. TMED11]
MKALRLLALLCLLPSTHSAADSDRSNTPNQCANTTPSQTTDKPEPWLYPPNLNQPSNKLALHAGRIAETYIEHAGVRTLQTNSRMIHHSVASFKDIVQWYSDKWNTPDLPGKIKAFEKRLQTEPELTVESVLPPQNLPPKVLLTYWLSPSQTHITASLRDTNGEPICITILGMKKQTRIQVARHGLKTQQEQ